MNFLRASPSLSRSGTKRLLQSAFTLSVLKFISTSLREALSYFAQAVALLHYVVSDEPHGKASCYPRAEATERRVEA